MLALLALSTLALAAYSAVLGFRYNRLRATVRSLVRDSVGMLCVLYRLRRIFKGALDRGARLSMRETHDGYAFVLSAVGDSDERQAFHQAQIMGIAVFKKSE